MNESNRYHSSTRNLSKVINIGNKRQVLLFKSCVHLMWRKETEKTETERYS